MAMNEPASVAGRRSVPSRDEGVREEERILLTRCRRGDEAAFATLVSRYRERLINLAYQLLQDQAEAEDVAQEVFIKLFTSLPTFRGDATLFTYLYRLTFNLCHSRRRRKKWELETRADLDDTEEVEDDFCEQVVTKLLVEHVLAELPPEQRTVLLLREWHELSYDEIARITGAHLGTVKSRLNAARRAFQEGWGKLNITESLPSTNRATNKRMAPEPG